MFIKVALAALILATAACRGSQAVEAPAAGPLAVAAAADLRFALEEIVGGFATSAGADVAVTYGSSGTFFAQLQNGAPFDVFLSADAAYPRELAARRLTAPDSPFQYAEGRIVLWVPRGSALDIERRGLQALTDRAVTRVAIANPAHAPYGRAALAAFASAGVLEAVKPRLVLGENVSQTLQFVESRAADAGIVALSLARAPAVSGTGRYWMIPVSLHPPIEQGGAILASSRRQAAARAFQAYLTGAAGRAVLERYGFTVPASVPAAAR